MVGRPDPIQAWVERVLDLPRPLLLAFDVDGTLAPIVEDPATARVPAATASDLRVLSTRKGLRVALVTGRDSRALYRMLRVPEAWRAVEHGRVLLAPGEVAGVGSLSREQRASLANFARWAKTELVPQGARLERKPASLGVHTRGLKDAALADALLRAAAQAAKSHGLKPRRGRAVLEAEVETGDKGEALRALQRKTRARGVFYVGDDLTDLPPIRHANAQRGIGLFVRSAERPRTPRGASGSLNGPGSVARLIHALAAQP